MLKFGEEGIFVPIRKPKFVTMDDFAQSGGYFAVL